MGELSDERLLGSLRELLAAEGRSEARIVAHLAEVDARRIHLKASAPSLFEYCQKRLGLSDNQAYYRIAAARVAQRFPVYSVPLPNAGSVRQPLPGKVAPFRMSHRDVMDDELGCAWAARSD